MYHISAALSLLSKSFVSVQHSHPCKKVENMTVGFHSVAFGVHSNISVGEDGLHRGECVRQNYSFFNFCFASGVWSYCEAQVLKGAHLFHSFPFAKNVTYRKV